MERSSIKGALGTSVPDMNKNKRQCLWCCFIIDRWDRFAYCTKMVFIFKYFIFLCNVNYKGVDLGMRQFSLTAEFLSYITEALGQLVQLGW